MTPEQYKKLRPCYPYKLANGQTVNVPDLRIDNPSEGCVLHQTHGSGKTLTVISREGEPLGFWEVPKGKHASDYPKSFPWTNRPHHLTVVR